MNDPNLLTLLSESDSEDWELCNYEGIPIIFEEFPQMDSKGRAIAYMDGILCVYSNIYKLCLVLCH
jgi:hypothetical protein